MLAGDNSILQKAAEAKERTAQAEVEEQRQLAMISAEANIHGTTQNGVKIPAGFALTGIEGESTVDEGLVITDSNGNEYVWIPVFEKSDDCTWGVDYSNVRAEGVIIGSDAYYTAIETALKDYTETYKNESYTDVWYGDVSDGKYGYYDGTNFVYYTNGNMTESEYKVLYRGMLKSVFENGGFYIGRYEMGIKVVNTVDDAKTVTRVGIKEYTPSSDTSETITNNTAAVSISGMTKPLSQANAVVYSCITQSQAEMLAESLNYSGTKSSILFGVQWDAVCVYLEHYGKTNSIVTSSANESFNSSYLTNNDYSKLWGNYKTSKFLMNRGFYSIDYNNTTAVTWNEKSKSAKDTDTAWLCTTGASDQNKVCNICDFGGNLSEFTLEKSFNNNYPCVGRGSSFVSNTYVSIRGNLDTRYSGYGVSARLSLYISN